MFLGNKSRRSIIDKEEDFIAEAAKGLLQLRDYFAGKQQRKHPIQHNPPTTTTTTKKKKKSNTSSTISRNKSRSFFAVKDLKIAKTRPNMNGQKRSRKDDYGMKPEISAAKRLLQLCIDTSNRCDKGFNITPHMEEEVKHLRSHHIGSIDKSNKVQGDDEESKSDMSYITDDSSDMETTLAEISAAQQIMQLSNSHQKATTTTAEDEEGSSGYNTASSGAVLSARKDFEEESNAFLRRKRKFRSLADLYEITQPLEDSTLID